MNMKTSEQIRRTTNEVHRSKVRGAIKNNTHFGDSETIPCPLIPRRGDV